MGMKSVTMNSKRSRRGVDDLKKLSGRVSDLREVFGLLEHGTAAASAVNTIQLRKLGISMILPMTFGYHKWGSSYAKGL